VRSLLPCTLAVLLLAPACATEPTKFVAGPEDPTLLDGLSGSILVRNVRAAPIDREIERYTLPDRRHTTWKLFHGATNFSGPDDEGRIVYNTDDQGFAIDSLTIVPSSHVIRVAHLDGGAEEILVSEDGRLWGGDVLALSGSGGWVAYIHPNLGGQQMLIVVRIGEGVRSRGELIVPVAANLHWLMDGKLLVLSGSMEWSETPAEFRPREPVTTWNGKLAKVPLIYVVDVETADMRILCRGERPIPVPGQLAVLARDETGYFTIDAETGERIRPGRQLPGALEWGSYVVGVLDADRVLYLGRPTEGTKVRTYYEPGKCMYCARPTIKVADLTRGTFATVVQNVLPPITSYGR
jgi:hypothetical protein